MMTRLDRIAALLLCTAAIAGCGGGDDEAGDNLADRSVQVGPTPQADSPGDALDSVAENTIGSDWAPDTNASLPAGGSGPPSEPFIPATPPPPVPKN
jgi:hypothetical protein